MKRSIGRFGLWSVRIAAAVLGLGALSPTGPAAAVGSSADGWDCSAGFVALTFDDGPHVFAGDHTSVILDTLRDFGVHATFFVLGERVDDPNQPTRPDLVLRESAEGHVVGNHTWDHPDLTGLTAAEVESELSRDNAAILAAGAPRPGFLRPPYGSTNDTVAAVAKSLGLLQVLWDVNTGDTAATSAASVSAAVLAAVRPGSVVVLHDGSGPYTAEALPSILEGLKAARLCPGVLSPSSTYNAQVRSYVDVVPDPQGPHSTTPRTCPCTIFLSGAAPAQVASPVTGPHEVGVRFVADVPGRITAIRYYRAATNTGPHTVHLWSAGGTLLATAPAVGETQSGWQEVPLGSPVQVAAATPYVASYAAPAGRFSQDVDYFAVAAGTAPIRAPATTSGAGNGVYATATGVFPTLTYRASNYWVDVVFVPGTTLTAADDSYSTGYGEALTVPDPGVLANDVGSDLSVSAWSAPAHGSVTMRATGGFTYTPASGFSGTDSFTYTARSSGGATAAASVHVVVSAPATVARDSFSRTVTGGWGTATLGGTWSPADPSLSVDGQRGVIAVNPGQARHVVLAGVRIVDSDMSVTVQLNAVPGGTGGYTSLVARNVATDLEYRGTVRVRANGTVTVLIYRMNGTQTATIIGKEVRVPVAAKPGSTVSMRFTARGASPTRLSLTVWKSGSAEPLPQVTASDSTAALQVAGAPGVCASLSSSASTLVRFSYDDLAVRS